MGSLHVVGEVLVELETDQLGLPPGVVDLLRDGLRDPGLGHGDAVLQRHAHASQAAQLHVVHGELRQRGRPDPLPLDPVHLLAVALPIPLPREDGLVEAGGGELAVGARPAAAEQVAEALPAVERGVGEGGRLVVVGAEAEVAEAVDDAVDGGGRRVARGGGGRGRGGVGGGPLLHPWRAAAAGRGRGAVAAGRGGGGGGGGGRGGAGQGEEAEGEEGAGGEAEGVVEGELGERHGGGGGGGWLTRVGVWLTAVAPWMGVRGFGPAWFGGG